MKRLVLSFAILSAITFSMNATPRNEKRTDKGRNHHERLAKELNITAEQKSQLEELNSTYRTKQRDLSKEHKEKMDNILSPEQREKMESLKKDRRHFAGKKRGARHHNSEMSKEIYELKQSYLEKEKAIEMSRVSPEEQGRRKKELWKEYKSEVRKMKQNNKAQKG